MAEIKIQEKKASIWPWIIAILAIAAIVYFVIYYMDNNKQAEDGVFYLRESINYAQIHLFNAKGLLYG